MKQPEDFTAAERKRIAREGTDAMGTPLPSWSFWLVLFRLVALLVVVALLAYIVRK